MPAQIRASGAYFNKIFCMTVEKQDNEWQPRAEDFALRRRVYFPLQIILLLAGYAGAPYLAQITGWPPSICLTALIMTALVLGHQFSCEFFLRKIGPTAAIVIPAGKQNPFKDARDQLDQCRRKTYRRRLNGVFMLFFSIPAAIWVARDFILKISNPGEDHFGIFCLVLTVWMLSSMLCIKATNWFAVQKFGAVEKKEQEAKRIELRKNIPASQRKSIYFKFSFGIFTLLFCVVAVFVDAYVRAHDGGISHINEILLVFIALAAFFAWRVTEKKSWESNLATRDKKRIVLLIVLVYILASLWSFGYVNPPGKPSAHALTINIHH